MKKYLLLMAFLPLFMVSCSDDDDNSESLDGTVWESVEIDTDYEYKSTIKFSKSTYQASGYEIYKGDKDEFSGGGTYVYDHPNIIFTEGGESIHGSISGNKMTVGEDDIVYTKK